MIQVLLCFVACFGLLVALRRLLNMKLPPRWFTIGYVALGVFLAVALRRLEYQRVYSPDERFYIVAEYPAYQGWLPVMPGGGGDKAGYVTLYTADGQKLRSDKLDMMQMIGDLHWSSDSVEIRTVLLWDLPQ